MATRRVALWLPVAAYMAAIYFLSAQSAPLPSVTSLVWDKALHFTEYGVLGVLWCRALRGEGRGWSFAIVLAFAAAAAYGASDEWHQSYVALRSSDIRDWFADLIGIGIGLIVYRLLGALREPEAPRV